MLRDVPVGTHFTKSCGPPSAKWKNSFYSTKGHVSSESHTKGPRSDSEKQVVQNAFGEPAISYQAQNKRMSHALGWYQVHDAQLGKNTEPSPLRYSSPNE